MKKQEAFMIRTLENARLQAVAMGANCYEIGLLKQAGPLGSEANMLTRIWDLDSLVKSISWLSLQNSRGRNIYIRPKGEHHLSLVDDLTWSAVRKMKESGFQPAVLIETSPGNFQAWLNHGRVLPKELSSAVAKRLAERFDGDVKAAAWRQYGRLAGFTNRKEKHRQPTGLFPFVRLIEVSTRVYERAEEFVASIAGELKQAKEENTARQKAFLSKSISMQQGHIKNIEDFRRNPQYGGDGSRIDLAYAVYALSHGVPEDNVRQAIASRDLTKKGTELRQQQYIDRTVAKAFTGAGLSR
jgi:hypothetical protein